MQSTQTQQHSSIRALRHPLWLLSGFWICVVIAMSVVFRRLVELIRPSYGRPPQMAAIDAIFSSHAVLTATHIIPAAIFVALAGRSNVAHRQEPVARTPLLSIRFRHG